MPPNATGGNSSSKPATPASNALAHPEPWLRGLLTDVPVLTRAVLHALALAEEDIERWCAGLSDDEMNGRPAGIVPVAFHLRHISRSADRLLTYADGRQLSSEQVSALKTELDTGAAGQVVFAEFRAGIESAAVRVRAFNPAQFDELRKVGKQQLPTTVGSLLIHVADHTQRHVGQAITTAKIVIAARR
ncbi:MAG: DinB family protein [Candidatus Acidiferrales bacterium]